MNYHFLSSRCLLAGLILGLAATGLLLVGCETAPGQTTRYQTPGTNETADTEAARHYNDLAVYAVEAGDLDTAEELLKDALTADVGYGPAHNNLGKVYLEQGRLYLAAWEFEYASKLMPYRPEPRNNLGLVLESVRKLDDAITQYQAAHRLEPNHPELIGNLVRAKLRRGDPPPEVRELLRELLLKDQRPEWRDWAEERLARLAIMQ